LYQHRLVVRVLEDAAAIALHEAYGYAIEQVWRSRNVTEVRGHRSFA
jgi:hypothetical protein